MLRLLISALAVLHLAPAFAFAVLAFGCDPYTPWLGGFCGQPLLKPFLQLTALSAAVLVLAFALAEGWRRRRAQAGA